VAAAGLCAGHPLAWGQVVATGPGSLAELSLEQLSDLPVTSVSGRPESLRSAPASVFVISGEDIRRSSATNLPEALRLAPNLQVARLNSGQYAISARGFNDAIGNKLLVLIDGRTVYSSLYSGVFWDAQNPVLEDIERIEVISGPGGTLWGANAVNGIINVITKPAAATQGTLASVTRSRAGGRQVIRGGTALGEVGHARLYAQTMDRGTSRQQDGTERQDATSQWQLGFRADSELRGGQLTVQGDAHGGGEDPGNVQAPKMRGSNLLARWDGRFAGGSPYRLQAYYDLQERQDPITFRNRSEMVDLQFSHDAPVPAGQQLLWGAGYRTGTDDNETSALVRFTPSERRLTWANLFAQHQVRVDRWQLTTGLKAEHNSYTGVEWLPNLRLAYEHAGNASTWAAASRTVRAPARLDRDFFFPADPPFVIAGGADFQSEVANVLEIGHRGQAGRDLSYSFTAFHQQYEGLRAGIGTPSVVSNRIDGWSRGVEAWGQWQPHPRARLGAGLTTLRKKLHFASGPEDPVSIPNLGNDPEYQWQLRAQFDLPYRTELDLHLRRVGALPAPAVPAYTSLDARIGWQVTSRVEVSLLGQNLLNDRHAEFDAAATTSFFGRRIFVKVLVQL
jgi:iron complex outermembrane receptor protein